MLQSAVSAVANLYMGEMVGEVLDSLDKEKRDIKWKKRADSFPPFKNKILGLRIALNYAREVYASASGEDLRSIFEDRFYTVKDLGAKHFLSFLLCSRSIINPGTIDGSIIVNEEARLMREELGFIEGINEEAVDAIGFSSLIESVLKGDLHLSRQSPHKDLCPILLL